jgi:prophage lambdaBa04, gp54
MLCYRSAGICSAGQTGPAHCAVYLGGAGGEQTGGACRAMKEFARGFYKSKAWQRTRAAYISSVSGLCEDCLRKGIYKPGEIVHHIISLTPDNISDASIALSWDNLKLVCRDCHGEEHRNKRRYSIDDNGKIFIKE